MGIHLLETREFTDEEVEEEKKKVEEGVTEAMMEGMKADRLFAGLTEAEQRAVVMASGEPRRAAEEAVAKVLGLFRKK